LAVDHQLDSRPTGSTPAAPLDDVTDPRTLEAARPEKLHTLCD
jgi:hypothetical protein